MLTEGDGTMSRVWLSRVYDATDRPKGPYRIAVRVKQRRHGSMTYYFSDLRKVRTLIEQLQRAEKALLAKRRKVGQ